MNNKRVCDHVWSCTPTWLPKADIVANGLNVGEINFFDAPCKSAGLALFLTMIHLTVRYFLHPRIRGVFSLVMFASLALSVVAGAYGDTWTASTWSTTSQIGAQLRNIAENEWSPGSSWDQIISAADFYAWLRNPMKDILFSGSANAGCGNVARSLRARKNPKAAQGTQEKGSTSVWIYV